MENEHLKKYYKDLKESNILRKTTKINRLFPMIIYDEINVDMEVVFVGLL